MTTTIKTTNWKQAFEQQRSSEIVALKRKQDLLQQELNELRLDPIKQDQQNKLKHLNDRVMSTKKELGKYPENVVDTIKRIEELHRRRNELLKRNELVLIVIQVKELDELISKNIPDNLQTAVEGLLQMNQLLDIVTDEQVRNKMVEIRDIHLGLFKKILPERLKDQLKACKWPNDLNDAVLDTLHLLTLLELDPISPFLELIQLHFLFHFCTDRPTNRVDKPEWALGYLIKQLEDSKDLINDHIVSIVDDFWEEYVKKTSHIGIIRMLQLKKAINTDLVPHYFKQIALFEHEIRTVFGVDVELFGEYVDEKWTTDIFDAYKTQTKESDMDDVELVQDTLIDIIRVLGDKYRIEFFKDALIPALDNLLQSILYQQPPFLGTVEEITRMCVLVSRLDKLAIAIDEWSDELWMLELESKSKPKASKNESSVHMMDPLDLKGISEEIVSVLSKMQDKLTCAIFDRYSTMVNPFFTSMHYGLPTKHILTMNDTYRRTLLDLSNTLNVLKRELPSSMHKNVLSNLEVKIEKHMIDRLILKNYFHEQGVELFSKDIQALTDVFLAYDGRQKVF